MITGLIPKPQRNRQRHWSAKTGSTYLRLFRRHEMCLSASIPN